MGGDFDADAIERLGWRQGSVLGHKLSRVARDQAPGGVIFAESDWLIVTSHDCDVVNDRLEKEPVVEVLRAEVVAAKAPDKLQVWGRNPRLLQFQSADGGAPVVLRAKVHERWQMDRTLLGTEAPARSLPDKVRRLIAEWLAKRYIRAAFPTAFDRRWRAKLHDWTKLLERQSAWIQGVYLRLDRLQELDDTTPYKIAIIVSPPARAPKEPGWASRRAELEEQIERFWHQFTPGIALEDIDIVPTDQLTLADIEVYQRFDADWVSFADDSPAAPIAGDLST